MCKVAGKHGESCGEVGVEHSKEGMNGSSFPKSCKHEQFDKLHGFCMYNDSLSFYIFAVAKVQASKFKSVVDHFVRSSQTKVGA